MLPTAGEVALVQSGSRAAGAALGAASAGPSRGRGRAVAGRRGAAAEALVAAVAADADSDADVSDDEQSRGRGSGRSCSEAGRTAGAAALSSPPRDGLHRTLPGTAAVPAEPDSHAEHAAQRDPLTGLVEPSDATAPLCLLPRAPSGQGPLPRRVVALVDMDCFFVAVRAAVEPRLRGRAVAVAHCPDLELNLTAEEAESATEADGTKDGTLAAPSAPLAGTNDDPALSPRAETVSGDEASRPARLGSPTADVVAPAFGTRRSSAPVGGSFAGEGEVSSCSYEARACGVRAGMRVKDARAACSAAGQALLVVPYDFARIEATARVVYQLFCRASRRVQAQSIDEAFLDLTGCPDPEGAVSRLRAQIFRHTGCSASAGIARSKLLAKLACSAAKRGSGAGNAQLCLADDDGRVDAFLLGLRAYDLPGVGYKAMRSLRERGVETMAEVRACGAAGLRAALGAEAGQRVFEAAWGHDPSEEAVGVRKPRQSVGLQVFWGCRFSEQAKAEAFVAETVCQEVSRRMAEAGAQEAGLAELVLVQPGQPAGPGGGPGLLGEAAAGCTDAGIREQGRWTWRRGQPAPRLAEVWAGHPVSVLGRRVTLTVLQAHAQAGRPYKSNGCGRCHSHALSARLPSATCDHAVIAAAAVELLRKARVPAPEIRGLALQISDLTGPGGAPQRTAGAGIAAVSAPAKRGGISAFLAPRKVVASTAAAPDAARGESLGSAPGPALRGSHANGSGLGSCLPEGVATSADTRALKRMRDLDCPEGSARGLPARERGCLPVPAGWQEPGGSSQAKRVALSASCSRQECSRGSCVPCDEQDAAQVAVVDLCADVSLDFSASTPPGKAAGGTTGQSASGAGVESGYAAAACSLNLGTRHGGPRQRWRPETHGNSAVRATHDGDHGGQASGLGDRSGSEPELRLGCRAEEDKEQVVCLSASDASEVPLVLSGSQDTSQLECTAQSGLGSPSHRTVANPLSWSQVDQSVLSEVPAELRAEVVRTLASGRRGIGTSSEPLAPAAAGKRSLPGRAAAGGSRARAQPSIVLSVAAATAGVAPANVDPGVWASLPVRDRRQVLQQLQRRGATVKSAIDRRAFLEGRAQGAPAAAADAAFLEVPQAGSRAEASATGTCEGLPPCGVRDGCDTGGDDACMVMDDVSLGYEPGSMILGKATIAGAQRLRARPPEAGRPALGTASRRQADEAPPAGTAAGLLQTLEPGSALARLLGEGMLTMSEPTGELQRLFESWAQSVGTPTEADARGLALLMCQLAANGREEAAMRALGSCVLGASRDVPTALCSRRHWRAVAGYAFERLADAVQAARGYRLHPGPLAWMLKEGN